MFQNIKVDVIYYKTPTDFEMEFNLSGCCRMRLLTDKAPDKKILVNQMVRAVSRSRIIIVSGSLFGEESIVETCSKAIGKPVAQIDNSQYGIDSKDEISVIKDAIPLVSKDGIFGGCIIEQGPQTLILLTDNKNIRKGIMQNLIHPYIQEIVAGELVEKEETVQEQTEEVIEEIAEVEEISEQSEEAEDETLQDRKETAEETHEQVSEAPNQLIIDQEDDEDLPIEVTPQEDLNDGQKTEEEVFDLFVESDRKVGRMFKKPESYYTAYDSEDYVVDQYEENNRKNGKGLNISILILSVVLLLVIGILCYCIFAVPQNMGVSAGAYLKDTINTLLG